MRTREREGGSRAPPGRCAGVGGNSRWEGPEGRRPLAQVLRLKELRVSWMQGRWSFEKACDGFYFLCEEGSPAFC